jgi:hypothetical protein
MVYKYLQIDLILVSLGLVRDYDNFWHATAHLYLPIHGHEHLFGIFSTWICIVFLVAMYAKSVQNVMNN